MIRFVPNALTLFRMALSVVLLAMILYMPHVRAASHDRFVTFVDTIFVLFLIAGLTDIIDGRIARSYNVVSKLGRIIDPLADKVLVCGAFICFALIGMPTLFNFTPVVLSAILWTVAGVITLRELTMTVVRHIAESRGINFAATPAGKLKMFVQSFAIGTILIKIAHVPDAAWGNWVTMFVLVAATVITVLSAIPAARRF
jgi:CDP-diacylglycerol---glycerol-3-phosphate 3-phosphatidyltransferase